MAHSTIGILLAEHGFVTRGEPNVMKENKAQEGACYKLVWVYILFSHFYLVLFLLVYVNVLMYRLVGCI